MLGTYFFDKLSYRASNHLYRLFINMLAVVSSYCFDSPGITAEEFVDRPKIGPALTDYGQSKYDIFRAKIAEKLNVPVNNVDIFTVMNHPELVRTCDVRYAAHGSPYYRPARLDGLVNENKAEVTTLSPHY